MDIPLWLQIVLQIFLQLALIMLNAVFACAEIAVIETKETRLETLASGGSKRAVRLLSLVKNPAKFLAVIQVAITLSGFLASAFAAENFSFYIVDALHGKTALSDGTINTVSVMLITIILSYFTLVFGELVPKRVAMQNAENIALRLSGTVSFIAAVFSPLVRLLTASTNAVLRLMKIDPNGTADDISEEDIRMMADAGSRKGVIDEEENEMIQNIFEFDDTDAEEIATHRTEMKVLFEEDDDLIWEECIRGSIHRYFPVCRESIDNVMGILDSSVYFRLSSRSREQVMKHAVSKPFFATQAMKTSRLFEELRDRGAGLAVIVDEYGGTYGIVTVTDLVERIMGELDTRSTREGITRSGKGYLISGLTEREIFDELFGTDTGSDSATIGGWITEKLGRIPVQGDKTEANGISVTVTKADEKHVTEIYAERIDMRVPDAVQDGKQP